MLVSEKLRGAVKKAEINSNVMGSDHCPVSITLFCMNNDKIKTIERLESKIAYLERAEQTASAMLCMGSI